MALSDKIGEATSLLNGYVMEKHTSNAQNPDNAPKTVDKPDTSGKRAIGEVKHFIYEDGKLVATSSNPKSETSRRFNVRTYIKPEVVDRFLKTAPWVHYWAYCHHDKDVYDDSSPKEPHTHILIYTYHQKTASAIGKIFERLDAQTRSEGAKPEKTHVEIMRDTTGSWRYLRHLDNPEKHQYSEDERVANMKEWWFRYERSDGLNDASNNRALAMFDDRRNGLNPHDFIERYGRDGLMFLNRIDDAIVKHRVETESNVNIPFDRSLLDLILNASNFSRQDIATFNAILNYVQKSCVESYGSALDIYLKEIKNA